jgi:hypothetical protein
MRPLLAQQTSARISRHPSAPALIAASDICFQSSVWTAAMSEPRRGAHRDVQRGFMAANDVERKQMCNAIHPGTPASKCIIYMTTKEGDVCVADPVGGPAVCRQFEVERKTEERNLVLVADMDLSEARTVAAANQSYKLTTALANARRVLPDGAFAVIVPEVSREA